MAELCKECFIEIWQPSQQDIENIVISEDTFICEGCGKWGVYVDYIEPYNPYK